MTEDHDESAGGQPARSFGHDRPRSSALLPAVESPPLSPAEEGPDLLGTPTSGPIAKAPSLEKVAAPRRSLRRRRNAILSAWGAGIVALGVITGMAIGAVLVAPTNGTSVRFADRKSVQQSLDALHEDIVLLKTRLVTAEKAVAEKTASDSAVATLSKTVERPQGDANDVTGSIPQQIAEAPLPPPRPVNAGRRQLVLGWSIRYVRDGSIFVQGVGGLYQVQLGAPLPGLGPVQDVQRRDGRWTVLTPKGLIVSLRDRRHFEQF